MNDVDTWYLRVSCWHRRSATVHSVDQATSDGLEWWARVNSCKFVGCTKVDIIKSKYTYERKPVAPVFEYDTNDDSESAE